MKDEQIRKAAERLIRDAPDSISFDIRKSHALYYVQNKIDGITRIPQKLSIHADLLRYWIDIKKYLESLKEVDYERKRILYSYYMGIL